MLLERRSRPGGRAFSFPDPDGGPPLDNGQHVLLGCCDRFPALLRRVGAAASVRFQPLLQVPVRGAGRWSTLGSARLPGPLHLLPALARYRHLSAAERVAALRAAAALAGAPPGDEQTFAAWLTRHGQGARAVARLWNLLGVGVLNCHASAASAGQACAALRMGFAAGWRAAALGLFAAPLGEVADRALAALARRGVSVRMGTTVRGLEVEGGRLRGVQFARGGPMEVDAAIAAVPHDALGALLPPRWRAHPALRGARELGWSPILDLHLHYDRPVLQGDLAAFLDGDLQFAFNRGRLLGYPERDGRDIALSISDAETLASTPLDALVPALEGQLRRALPVAAEARLLRAVPVWQRHATFRAVPGSGALRVAAASPIRGLALAGDWTATGWPACLEGAVRSGATAAHLVLAGTRPPLRASGGRVPNDTPLVPGTGA